jgi:TatD DNase family protein
MLETLPRERVLLETDCPYLAPEPGARNEPASVAQTAAYAARTWGMSDADTQALLADNFTRLFGVAP